MLKRIFVIVSLMALLVSGSALADAPLEGRAGRAEVRFMQGMIDHHQMALDMAAHCLERATTEEVLAICPAVIAAQTPEIEQMQVWLADWYSIDYQPMAMMGMEMMDESMGGHAGHQMEGMMQTDPAGMMGMFAGLNRAEGIDYDITWLEAMIDHHDDALHMSERILTRAEHEPLRALAEAIIDAQTTEIEQMETLLTTLNR
jgi:uncharacterized protein (DUF305 family)